MASQSALVVGAGSIGQRHGRLLCDLGLDVHVVTSRPQASHLPAYTSMADALRAAPDDLGYVVVASPTSRHARDVVELAELGFSGRVLIEKPIFARPDPAATSALDAFEAVSVNYNLRFHPAVRWLADRLQGQQALLVDIAAQSDLSSWRPDRAVAATSSAAKEAGGGVLRDLSHEIDLLLWLFGPLIEAHAVGGSAGGLDVEVETVCAAAMSLERAPAVTMRLSYVDPIPERRVRVTTLNDVIQIDLLSGQCTSSDGSEELAIEWDATYIETHRAVLSGAGGPCDPGEALRVLDAVQSLEDSLNSGGAHRR